MISQSYDLSLSAIALIPARLHSTRLPRKVLADINGHPMIWHIWQRVQQAQKVSAVYIATDSEEVREVVEGWGGQVLMTSPDCQSGTERLAECLDRIEADFVLNVQGDEPFVDPGMLDDIITHWEATQSDLVTPVFRIDTLERVLNPNVVKVVRTQADEALYFSRSPIPFVRDVPQAEWLDHQTFWGHIGVYGYKPAVLAAYPALPPSPLELTEKLEQLRFLEAGYRFQVVETSYQPVAVDTADDLTLVRKMMAEQS